MFRFTTRELVLVTIIAALAVSWWSDRQRIWLKLEQAELRARDAANDAEWKKETSELDALFPNVQPDRIWNYKTLVAASDVVCLGTVKSTKNVENTEFSPHYLDRFDSEIRVLNVLKGDLQLENL